MEEKQIDCYFCGKNATQIVESVDPRNLRIKCEHCKMYELTHEVLLYHYDEDMSSLSYSDENTVEKKELPQGLKDKLSEYVRNKFNSETGDPVFITMNVFQAVTGKSSVHMK